MNIGHWLLGGLLLVILGGGIVGLVSALWGDRKNSKA